MSREISEEEAQKRLEQAVNNFNWIEEFLDDKKDSF